MQGAAEPVIAAADQAKPAAPERGSALEILRIFLRLGLTSFGLLLHRPADSIGVGSAWSWLNRLPGSGFRSNELILQTYYQAHVVGGIFFQPTLSYVPNPGQSNAVHRAIALTLQSTVLF